MAADWGISLGNKLTSTLEFDWFSSQRMMMIRRDIVTLMPITIIANSHTFRGGH